MGATRRLSILVSREMPSFVKDHTTWQISFCQEGPKPPPINHCNIYSRVKNLAKFTNVRNSFHECKLRLWTFGDNDAKTQNPNNKFMFVYFVVSHWTWNLLRGFIPSSSSSRLSSHHHHLLIMIRPVRLPLGLAPRMARLTLAFLPSMIGFGSLHARSAASLFDIITWNIFLSGWKNISLISNIVCLYVSTKKLLTKPYPRDFPVLLSVITTASSMSP